MFNDVVNKLDSTVHCYPLKQETEQKKEESFSSVEEEKGSSELAYRISLNKKDSRCLSVFYACLEDMTEDQEIEDFLKEPCLKARLSAISVDIKLNHLCHFFENTCVEKFPLALEKFLLGEIARIYTDCVIHELCSCSVQIFQSIEHLFMKNNLSESIKKSLGSLQLFLKQKEGVLSAPFPWKSSSASHILFFSNYWIPPNFETKRLAIEVGDLIDGHDFHRGGIRLWIHQPPRGEDPAKAGQLISKQIHEFESGRRSFIFKYQKEPVPFQNYQEIMRYIIRCLKEDRAVYYAQTPCYIDKEFYTECASLFEKGERCFDIDPRYSFEWAARKLVALEERVEQITTEQEIDTCLNEFKKYYHFLSNFNMDLTVCSCIVVSCLSRTCCRKPVIVHETPPLLLKLADRVGINIDSRNKQILPLRSLYNTLFHTPSFEKIYDSLNPFLKKIFLSAEGNIEVEEVRNFLQAWYSLPQFPLLKEVYDQGSFASIKNWIRKCEDFIGLNEDEFHNLHSNFFIFHSAYHPQDSAFASKCRELSEKYGLQFFMLKWNPEQAFTLLQHLKAEMEELKSLEIKYQYERECLDFLEKLEEVLNTKNEFLIEGKENFLKEIKKLFSEHLLLPDTIISPKVKALWKSVSKVDRKNLQDLARLIDEICELKQLLFETLKDPELVKGHEEIWEALSEFPALEEALAEEVLKVKDSDESQIIRLISRLGVSQGLLAQEVDNREALRRELEGVKKEWSVHLLEMRRYIANSPSSLKKLENNGKTLNEAIQVLQGSLNVGMRMIFDRLLAREVEVEKNLLGRSTQIKDVIGKIRVVASGEEFSAAQEGEILVIQNVLPDVHKYVRAAAIISEQGGIFSHAVLTFEELGIPALVECNIEAFYPLNGKRVLLHLGDSPSFHSLEDMPVMDSLHVLTPEIARQLEFLPESVKKAASRQFYQKVFARFSSEAIIAQFDIPLAREFFAEEISNLTKLKKKAWKAEYALQRAYFFNQLEKKLGLLCQVAEQWNPSQVVELERTRIDLRRFRSELPQESVFIPRRGGKKENLDILREFLPKLVMKEMELKVPPYQTYSAEELVWSSYPHIKEKIIEIICSADTAAEKSKKIQELMKGLSIDPARISPIHNLRGEIIVRSSARLEDQACSAAAGIFDSVPVWDRKEMGHAFLQVIASSFSEKAFAFYEARGIQDIHQIFQMDCIVQEYVSDASYSGVGFSVANEKQWDKAEMQLVYGLGGGVNGLENPFYASVDTKDMAILDLGMKKEEFFPCEWNVVKEIASLLKQLESYFQCPVEIEFAGKGKELFIVQVRPITKYH